MGTLTASSPIREVTATVRYLLMGQSSETGDDDEVVLIVNTTN